MYELISDVSIRGQSSKKVRRRTLITRQPDLAVRQFGLVDSLKVYGDAVVDPLDVCFSDDVVPGKS